ncbi:hypothetical protein [Calidifontibacter terrae]
MSFFEALGTFLIEGEIVIDRAKGTAHPRYPDVIYPIDYGFLAGTSAADGEGIDLFRGSAVGQGLVGVYFTADGSKRDVEAKLLIDCTPQEVHKVGDFLASALDLAPVLVRRTTVHD